MRITLVLAVLALGPQAHAESTTEAARSPFSGFYIGAFAGAAAINATLVTPSITVQREVPVTIPPQRIDSHGDAGAIFGLRTGWGQVLGQGIYLGIEGEVTFPQLVESRIDLFGISFSGRHETEGSAYLRAGWTPDGQTLMFVRGGIAILRQVMKVGSETVERSTPMPAFGLGIEHMLTRHVSIRADMTIMPAVQDNQLGTLRGVVGLAWYF